MQCWGVGVLSVPQNKDLWAGVQGPLTIPNLFNPKLFLQQVKKGK
jgi:hypothetical protein